MARIIDQIRASKLPSNMMQFAARGALQVPAAENIEILVYLARHNKVFGELARMTLAGWDEKASRAAAADPQTSAEVLDYFISPDNLRPRLLPALLENPSVPEGQLVKLALSASREVIEANAQEHAGAIPDWRPRGAQIKSSPEERRGRRVAEAVGRSQLVQRRRGWQTSEIEHADAASDARGAEFRDRRRMGG